MNSTPNESGVSRPTAAVWLKTGMYGIGTVIAALCCMWVIINAETTVPLMPPAGENIKGQPAFRFAVCGDNRGNMSTFEKVMAGIKNENVDFILHTGDIVKKATERRFNWVLHEIGEEQLGVPVYAVPGNHDIREDFDSIPKRYMLYNKAFGPRRYWFSYGNALFVAFDNASKQASQDDLDWLDLTLDNYREKYTLCFVYMHVPPRDPRPGNHTHAMTAGADQLVAILKKHDVSAVFAGHIHGYLKDNIDGIPIYITGGAGADLYEDAGGQYNYLVCNVAADGSFTVNETVVDKAFNTDYTEYWFRTRFWGNPFTFICMVLIAVWFAVKTVLHIRAAMPSNLGTD